jgi:hypothetical protein
MRTMREGGGCPSGGVCTCGVCEEGNAACSIMPTHLKHELEDWHGLDDLPVAHEDDGLSEMGTRAEEGAN